MFISKQMAFNSKGQWRLREFPKTILVNSTPVNVVDSFKLLGVTIDKKLNFRQHVRNIKKDVNKRLFSIKRLFFLPFSVKLQFFKSFIIPVFDYCSTLERINLFKNKEKPD